jgi:hypothetical protein
MSDILIIGQGQVAKAFVEEVASKEHLEHHYVLLTMEETYKSGNYHNVTFVAFDPTSLFRLKQFCFDSKFKSVFIIYGNMAEAKVIYNNLRQINQKVRVIVLDTDKSFKDIESDSYVNIIDSINLLTNRLYDYLPNVPVIAQNVGLHEGEIMEVIVPFSSSYAFRHISSIPQIKWKIAAIYRNNKLLLPTNATMIRPRDLLLIIGKPQILRNVYKRIRSENGIFPEPFGKNFYLYIDIDRDGEKALAYIEESIYLLNKFDNKTLVIRIVNPNNLDVVNRIKEYSSDSIRIYFTFTSENKSLISNDILEHEIGLILLSFDTLKRNSFSKELYDYKKLIYIFGQTTLKELKEAVVVCNEKKTIEEISSVAFYISETLKITLSLRDYNPQGKFTQNSFIVEHFESLAHVHNTKVDVTQEKKNPIKAIKNDKSILLVIPFSSEIDLHSIKAFIKRDVDSLLLRTNTHPKLLIPVVESQGDI